MSASAAKGDKRMLVKFETTSNRVKGLAFHAKRPWILASLHNGVIQLWDYRMETLIDTFEEHDGPVRGVNFHVSQPLFVSGGDDYKIKVWNYSKKRCLFNLLGHLDYIRTVQFHHEYPWILSASDDQTIRLWNWQSRTQLQVLTGHNHYVMCAQFHPKEDTILSASLDQTARVWDYSVLRKKSVTLATDIINTGANNMAGGMSSQQNTDYFGANDVTVKHVLEGHQRGVNWANFHRTMPLIVTGADDREIKLWRYNESKAWEVDTLRGHMNNVSCVMFHPKKEFIVSDSEDKTIRVWDISKVQPPQVFRRDADRYWILESHPNVNLMAAGHDSGLLVFKLQRERPPYDSAYGKRLIYYKDLFLYDYDFKTDKEKPILSTRRRGAGPNVAPRTLQYCHFNQTQHCILLTYDSENEKDRDDGTYELYVFPKGDQISRDDSHAALRGFGKTAVWVSRNRFAVLDKTKQLWLKGLTNETKRKINVAGVTPLAIWPGGIGRLLIRTADAIVLYDIQALKVVGELKIANRHPIKYVVWSGDQQYVALFSKANIYLVNGPRFEEMCAITENSRVKSGAWDACGVFVYTTATHVKYLIPNGDTGIIRTLENPIYVTAVNSQFVSYLDRENKCGKLAIDATEYLFKVALMKRKYKDVLKIMKSKKLVGQSIIAYLQKKGHPEVALHFVQDETIKFGLALECGNIVVALECAKKLDNNDCWHKLGVEALRQGNHEVVEFAYQRTKNFERLSFLYLITGNIEKLSKMLKIAALRDDMLGRFHNALFLGDVQERVNVLRDAGQTRLAWLTARVHGLSEEQAKLEQALGDKLPKTLAALPPELADPALAAQHAALLYPPNPILKQSNWPLLEVRKSFPDGDLPDDKDEEKAVKVDDGEGKAMIGDEDDDLPAGAAAGAGAGKIAWGDEAADSKKPAEAKAGGWDADDLNLGLPADDKGAEGDTAGPGSAGGGDYFLFPHEGKSAASKWANNSPMAADMIAAGSFDMACGLLNRQIGVVNFAPLKPFFMSIFTAAHAAVPQLPTTEPWAMPILRAAGDGKDDTSLPELPFKLSHCVDILKNAYGAVTEGKFGAALAHFTEILHTIPLLVLDKKAQVAEVAELIEICREYVLAMRLETTRKEEKDQNRAASLSAYFTRLKLQPMHLLLGLRVAVKATYSTKNFKTCAAMCQRILELCLTNSKFNLSKAVDLTQIKGALKVCEKTPTDAADLKYSETDALILCADSFTPIPKNTPSVKCPYCAATYKPACAGSLCRVCQLSKVDAEASGLRVFPA